MKKRSVLVDALSGFWHRFFRDLGDFDALYEGTEAFAAQLYLDLLHETLGSALADARLVRREDARLLKIREDQVRRHLLADGVTSAGYVDLDSDIATVRYLQDAPVAPKKVIPAANLPGNRLRVPQRLRDLLDGMAVRPVVVSVAGKFARSATGAAFDLRVGAGHTLRLDDGREYVVKFATTQELYLEEPRVAVAGPVNGWGIYAEGSTVPLMSGTGGQLTDVRTAVVQEYAVWALDVDVDDQLLYRTIGNLVDADPQRSTEIYRSFIKGLLELYVKGPSLKRLESALTVAAGFPVVQSDGERVAAIRSNSVQDVVVVTNRAEYVVPYGTPLAPQVVVGAVLNALDPIVAAVNVVDYVEDPYWWHGMSIPPTIAPGLSAQSRRASTDFFPNVIGPGSGWQVGDPGFLIGGDPLPGGEVASVHRTAAFTIVDRYLKRNMFGVRFAPYIEKQTGLIAKLSKIVQEVRPPGTYAHIWPQTHVTDEIQFTDDVLVKTVLPVGVNTVGVPDSNWLIGQGVVQQSAVIIGGTRAIDLGTLSGANIVESPVLVSTRNA